MSHMLNHHYQHPSKMNLAEYQALYQESIMNPDKFWGTQALKYLSWEQPWYHLKQGDWKEQHVDWFVAAELNVCYNCVDRHLEASADKVALIWEGDDPNYVRQYTYQELYEAVCRSANVLKSLGITKGDRVCLYMPQTPDVVISMLACARIGAVHTVVFAGFSSNSLKQRINDAACNLVITADVSKRGGKTTNLLANVQSIRDDCKTLKNVLVVKQDPETRLPETCVDFYTEMLKASPICPPVKVAATDPLFILYTSGSTGQPKGIQHSSGGYLLYATMTYQWVFGYQPGDIHWCSADAGWITGHSYVVYGPLASGATVLLYGGVPEYPTPSRCWQLIDKHKVTSFYTAPTLIRSLMRHGEAPVEPYSLESLKILGSVGEPINPSVWMWFYKVVGRERCPVIDTWWQTETGGILLTSIPGITPLQPGSAGVPFFGVQPDVVDVAGQSVAPGKSGSLVIKQPWPGQMQTVFNDPKRYRETYLEPVVNAYFSGDAAHQSLDGYFWLEGRIDDVLNVSGHRLGTAEIESAVNALDAIAESAVVAIPHEIKGEGLYIFVTPVVGIPGDDALADIVSQQVRTVIGPIATPEKVLFSAELPKTRSGKIMRRILRNLLIGDTENVGDVSTLANPSIIDLLKQQLAVY